MKIFKVLTVAILLGVGIQCKTPTALSPEGEAESCVKNKEWFNDILDGLRSNSGTKSEIIRYTYHNQTVYYVDSCKGCPDSMALVYTCSGEIICQFGGIAGLNTCADFKDFATDKKVIWQN